MTPPDAPTPPEAPELATLPPGLLILIDKADDWLEASKLANRDFATAQHGIAADLKRKAFVEFIHASVRENPKTLQTGLSLLRSLARRLQEAEAEREFLTGVIAERNEELRAIFVALHPECPAHPGVANHCHPSTCDCFAADYMERQIPAQLQQAHSAGVALGREQAAKERDAAVVAARHEEYASAMALLRKYAAHVADNEGTDFATDHLAPLAGYNDWSAEEVAALKRALGPQAAGTGREGAA